MPKISIRTRAGTFLAEMDRSDLTDELWLSLPFEGKLNMLGKQIYFELPLSTTVMGDQKTLEEGDVAYWPEAQALCLFFGPTPLSQDDGRPVSRYPVKRIGHLLGDYQALERSGDGCPIRLERAF
ncbi:MAG: cyclophilin-like fold protein [Candidatus Methanomethylophilaceae archaeon]|jgi:hypothetical protein